jgi:hypothetical protein
MRDQLQTYRTQSFWSDPGRWAPLAAEIPPVPDVVVRVVSGLLCHPFLAPMRNVKLPASAEVDRGIRSVETMLERLLSRDNRPLTVSRTPENRFFCVCSGFARLAASAFRAHSIPARCRVGFAAYFTPGFLEDHWVCEYWEGEQWRLLDAELDEAAVKDFRVTFTPWDVPRGQFIDASTAWCRLRAGQLDPAKMGLSALGLAGTWFVAGNVMLDVAALNKEEMLPWEKWSVGRELIPGQDVPGQWAEKFDKVTGLLRGAPDANLARRVYDEDGWLKVTPTVLSFLNAVPTEVVIRPADPGRRT